MKKFLLKEIVVWLLIVIGVIIFSTFTYIIATNKGSFLSSIVTYKTQLAESSGIYVGTKVTIHGTNTGNVVKTTLLPSGQVEIRFSVKRNHVFGVTESSVVQLQNSGALGDRFINILTDDLSAPRLKKGSLIPYRKSASFLSLLTDSEGTANRSITDIISKIDRLVDNVNQEGVSSLLSPTQQKDLTQVLKSAKNILQKVESGQGTLGALINDPSLYNRLLILLGQRPKKNYLQDLSRRSQKKSKK